MSVTINFNKANEGLTSPGSIAELLLLRQQNVTFKNYAFSLLDDHAWGYTGALLLGTGVGAAIGAGCGTMSGGLGAGPGAAIGAAVGLVVTASTTVAIPAIYYLSKWQDSVTSQIYGDFNHKISQLAAVVDEDLLDPVFFEVPRHPVCIKGSPRVYDKDTLMEVIRHCEKDNAANKTKNKPKPPIPIAGKEFFDESDIVPSVYGSVVSHGIAIQILKNPHIRNHFSSEELKGVEALLKEADEKRRKLIDAEFKHLYNMQQKHKMPDEEYVERVNAIMKMKKVKFDDVQLEQIGIGAKPTAAAPPAASAAAKKPASASTATAAVGGPVKPDVANQKNPEPPLAKKK